MTTSNHSHQPTKKKRKKAVEVVTEESISLISEETPEVEVTEVTPEVEVVEEVKPVKPAKYESKDVKNPRAKYQPTEPKGHIIRVGEEITVPGDDLGNAIRTTEDVYREVFPRNSKRPSFILLFPKNTIVPKHAVRKLG